MNRGTVRILMTAIMLGALLCTSHDGNAQEAPAPVSPGEDVEIREVKPDLETMGLIWIQEGNVKRLAYVVQTGDTLWDVASRYLNSPYYWPKIWERNTFIINPHLIFPGDILYIYPEGLVVKSYEEAADGEIYEVSALQEGTQKRKEIRYETASSTGFIAKEELEAAGKIVDSLEHKKLLGEGDIVYVDVGKVDRVEPGDRYSAFRVMQNIKTGDYFKVVHPITGELVGYQVQNLGEIEIKKVEPESSAALIINSYMETMNGDLIRPYFQPLAETVEVSQSEVESLHGYIIASKDNRTLIGEDDIVYIDRGIDDGVRRGNKFIIYEPCRIVKDGLDSDRVRIPEKIVGELVILEPMEKTSVGLVTEAFEEIIYGERVFTSKYDYWEIEGVSQAVDVERCRNDPRCRLVTNEEYEAGMDNPYCDKTGVEPEEQSRWRMKDIKE